MLMRVNKYVSISDSRIDDKTSWRNGVNINNNIKVLLK